MSFRLFIGILFVLATGQLFRIAFGNGLVIQVTDGAVFIVVFAWAIQEIMQRRFFTHLRHPFSKAIGLFAGVGLVSLIFNSPGLSLPALAVSFLYLVRWIMYAGVFYLVKSFPKEKRMVVIRSLTMVLSLILLAGYLQYIFYPNLKNLYYLGWDDHLFRLFSTFLDPNFAAGVFSVFLLFLLAYLFVYRKVWKRDALVAALLFVFSFGALLLTYSRSGYLTFAAGSIVLFVLLRRWLYLFLVLAALVLGIIVIPKNLHSAGVELWRTASILARSDSAKQAVAIFVDHPVLGVGFDSYRYAQKSYGYANGKNWEVSHSGGGTDNSILFVLATTGVIGLTAYLSLWWIIVRRTYRTYRSHKRYTWEKTLALGVLAATGALFVDSIFVNSLFYTFIMFGMWTMLGLLEER